MSYAYVAATGCSPSMGSWSSSGRWPRRRGRAIPPTARLSCSALRHPLIVSALAAAFGAALCWMLAMVSSTSATLTLVGGPCPRAVPQRGVVGEPLSLPRSRV